MSSASFWDISRLTFHLNAVPLNTKDLGIDRAFVSVAMNAKFFQAVVGGDGHTTRYKNHDNTAIVTVRAMQTSGLNDRLMALFQLDKEADNGAAVGGLLLADLDGRLIISGPQAWVEGMPASLDIGTEPSTFEWTIYVADAKGTGTFVGGH